jgi:hypothetical protein
MKTLKSLLVVFTCLSSFINPLLCSEQSYLNFHRLRETGLSKYQHHSTKLNVLQDHSEQHQLHVVKRQTVGTPEDEAYCSARISDAACSTGLNQGTIDAELTCGRTTIEQATRDAKGCAINEHGKYCSSAWRLFNVNSIELMNIEGNCSGVVVSGACPTPCHTLLEDFRSRLGCCINTLINNTRRGSSRAASVDYRVWNLCGVPLPAAECGNNPVTINPPDNVQQCTDEQYFNMKYTQNLCLPERGQPYVDAIVLDSRCNQTLFFSAEYVTNLCSMDDSGTVCVLTFRHMDPDLDLDTLNSACATSNVSCTSNCRDGINLAKTLRGCCINWVNFSISTPQALSYGVWKSCGVESPGFCESPLSLRGSATSIMEENRLNILLVVITGLICQYINFMGK